jgi:hypothetical protein
MTEERHVLLLIGSAKRTGSTSEALGTYLLEQLAARGWRAESIRLHHALRTEERIAALLAATDRADLIVLAFPLYIDCLPHLVIRALERIAARRGATGISRRGQLAAIANCGFPEAGHNDVALAICRRFADETGFAWAGGLALGGGGAIGGMSLATLDGRANNVRAALDQAAEALAAGESVPQAAIDLMAQPMVPPSLYLLMATYGWHRQAQQNGVWSRLWDRPYRT